MLLTSPLLAVLLSSPLSSALAMPQDDPTEAPSTNPSSSAPSAEPASAAAAPTSPTTTLSRHQRRIADVDVDILVAGAEADAVVAFDELQRVMSLFSSRGAASTALSTAAGGPPQSVDPEFFAVLVEAQRLAVLSKGAFSPVVATIEGKAKKVRVETMLQLDVASRTAQLKAGAAIDLDAVAWGYALDRARALLLERGVSSFVMSAAGDVVVGGQKADGSAWVVGVADPRGSGPFMTVAIDDAVGNAVMTSIDSEGLVVGDDGVRRHMIVDPRTRQMADKVRSVAVFSDDAFTAKCLSRAVFVLGVKDGLALTSRLKGANVAIVDAKNKVWTTAGLKSLAKKGSLHQRPPTDGE